MKRRYLWGYVIYLLLVWGGIRYWVRLPEIIEELWFKPVIWLLPLFWWRILLGGRPKMFKGKWLVALISGLLMGVAYFVLLVMFKGGAEMNIVWSKLGVALATAIVEELTVSGFILGYLDETGKKTMSNLLLVAVIAMLLRLPIDLWVYQIRGSVLWGSLVLVGSMALINGWLRRVTGNTVAPIIARMGIMLAVLG